VVIVGGKAASAYYMAKKIVKLVNAVGQKVPMSSVSAHCFPPIFHGQPSVSRPECFRAAAPWMLEIDVDIETVLGSNSID